MALVPEVVHEGRLYLPATMERRDPTAATRPLQFVSPQMGMVPEWEAEAAFRLGYLANVVAYRCVQILANDVARCPIRASRALRDASTVNDRSPLGMRLGPPPGGPAPKLSARKLIRWTMAQQIVTGRRGWEIETDDGRADGTPVAFWPLVAARLKAVPSTGGTEWFKSFKYGRWSDERDLQPGHVFYGWDPSGLDFRQPESALQAARFDLSMVVAADRYSVSFFRNNAVPATVVTTTVFPDQATRDRFQRQWSAEYAGPDNAGRTHFHEVGDDGDGPVADSLNIQKLGLSARDSQVAQLRKDALMEVAIDLGVPWSKLDASGRTYDNADAEDRTYWEERILPLMADLEDDVNMQLAPRMGDEVAWFDLSDVPALRRRIVPITQAVGAPALLFARLMTINEGRSDYGLPKVPDGDRFLTDDELLTLKGGGTDEAAVRHALVELEVRGSGEGADEDRGAGDADDRKALGAPASETPPKGSDSSPAPETRDSEATELRRSRVWRSTDAMVRSLEARWERDFRRLFARQERSVLSRVTGKRGRQMLAAETRAPADEVFDRAHWLEETDELSEALYEAVVSANFVRVSAMFGISFDVEAEWAQDFIRSRANQLAGQVTDTTYTALQDALAEGVSLGEGIPELSARVRHVFEVATQARSTTIARTEVISAFNGSAHLTATQLPSDVVGGQEWIATRDGRVRPEHAAADGQVVAMDAAFEVGGEALAYPGDPSGSAANTVQCRCTVAFLTPEEMLTRGAAPTERRVRYAEMRALIDLLHPEIDLLAVRRAMPVEVAA